MNEMETTIALTFVWLLINLNCNLSPATAVKLLVKSLRVPDNPKAGTVTDNEVAI